MFGKKKKKKKSMMEKVVMGAIVGGAIGSVIGMAVAPKKGEETRKYLKEKGAQFIGEHEEEIEEVKKKGGKIWQYLKKRLRKK